MYALSNPVRELEMGKLELDLSDFDLALKPKKDDRDEDARRLGDVANTEGNSDDRGTGEAAKKVKWLTVGLTPEKHQEIRLYVAKTDMTAKQLVRAAVNEYMDKHPAEAA